MAKIERMLMLWWGITRCCLCLLVGHLFCLLDYYNFSTVREIDGLEMGDLGFISVFYMYIVSPYHYLPLWQNLANFLFIISNVFWLDFCFLYGIFTKILYLWVALTEKVWDRFLCSICVCSHWCSLFLMYKMFTLLCKPTLLFSFLRLDFYLLRFFF